MSIISLDSRERYLPMDESQGILRKLHLDHHTLASDATANRFLRKGLNGPSGIRYIDASGIFKHVRHALGASAERTFGLSKHSQAMFDNIADRVNAELDDFVCARKGHGILVFRQECSADSCRLVPATGKDALFNRVVNYSNATLLIPTGRIGAAITECQNVFLRIDVARSRFQGAYFAAKEFIFTDENGKSIAGLGDIPEYIANIDDVHEALKGALVEDYDVPSCNARIFDAWWRHRMLDPAGDRIRIPLPANDGSESGFSMILERIPPTGWEVLLEEGESRRALAYYLPEVEMDIDIESVLSECETVKTVLFNTQDLIDITNFEHIFEDNFDRFPDEFKELFNKDYEEGAETFIEALERAKATPSCWQPAPYNEGNEKRLERIGDAESNHIQLLLPLLLTDDERRHGAPSVYAVVRTWRDHETGELTCTIPTILGSEAANSRIRSLRRLVRRACAKQSLGHAA